MVLRLALADYALEQRRKEGSVSRRVAMRRTWKGWGMLFSLALAGACSQEPPAAHGSATAATAAIEAAEAAVQTPPAAEVRPAAAASMPAVSGPGAEASVVQASASTFAVNTVLELDYPLRPNDYVWDEEGVPEGPAKIVIDLKAERLYVYRSGVEIGRSVIIYGADHKPTPLGTFTILEKDVDHVSNIYDGAPMPYMLRLTWDGIAIHGSGAISYEYATHGCVGLPDEFAQILFSEADLGDDVLVTTDWLTGYYQI
jgi:lipoprotein-anchoring transpeptidase ErfK/SrfK